MKWASYLQRGREGQKTKIHWEQVPQNLGKLSWSRRSVICVCSSCTLLKGLGVQPALSFIPWCNMMFWTKAWKDTGFGVREQEHSLGYSGSFPLSQHGAFPAHSTVVLENHRQEWKENWVGWGLPRELLSWMGQFIVKTNLREKSTLHENKEKQQE